MNAAAGPTKRARHGTYVAKPKAPRLRRKGALQEFSNMPLDIIEEVTGYISTPIPWYWHSHPDPHRQVLRYLFPNDLLNLARTTKPFRHLLMSKSSRIFWTLALHKVDGLPECPSFLSEPAYTNLCFLSVCHVSNQITLILAIQAFF